MMLLEEEDRQSIYNFQWVASDGWGRQHHLTKGLESVAQGAITLELESQELPRFSEYMARLTPQNNKRNPW